MPLPKDPLLLLSVVNTQLRDRYPSLAALCEDQQTDQQTLCAALAAVGFAYDPAQNQFR